LVALGVAGYVGFQYFVGQKLSPLLEAELSKFLKREVRMGAVESFSLNRIRFGNSTIPPTPTDSDSLSVKSVEVGFNPLPLLVGQPLAIDVVVADTKLYLEQDKTGKWLNLDLPKEKGELPVNLDVNVRLKDGAIALKPQGFVKPIAIQAQGKGRYRKQEQQQVSYDVDAAVLGSQVQVVGETIIETGRTQVDISLKQFSLAEFAFLIPNQKLKLKAGEVASDLTVNFPAFTAASGTQVKGDFKLKQLAATISPLKEPIKANLQLNLQGQKVKIEQGKASLGKLNAQLQGTVGWQEGYDLKLAVKPFRLEDLSKTLALSLPLKVAGEVESQINLTGSLTEPRLKGTVKNTKNLQIERTLLKEVRADFQADLERAVLTKLQIMPSAGGQLSGSGVIKTGLKQALAAKKVWAWQKMPFSLKLNGQLPAGKLLNPYYRLPSEFALGNLATQGRVGGTLGKPQASLQWQLSDAKLRESQRIKGRGEILLSGANFLLRDTAIEANRGTINLKGGGSFANKRWQADLQANSLILTPFLAIFCQTDCPAATLETFNAKVSGRLDNLNLAAIQGAGNLQVAVNNRPSVNSAFIIENSKFNIIANANQLELNPFIPNLTAPVALKQGQVNLSGSLTQLLSGNKQQATSNILAGLKGDGKIELTVNNQAAVNSEFIINNSEFKANATANRLELNPFIPNLTAPVALKQGQINLSGSLTQLLSGNRQQATSNILAGLKGDGKIELTVNNQSAINSEFIINNSEFKANATVNQLKLNPFIPNLTAPVALKQGQINLSGSLTQLLSGNRQQATGNILAGLKGDGKIELAVNNQSAVNSEFIINNSEFKANATVNQLELNPFIPNLTAPVALKQGQVNLSGSLTQLLSGNRQQATGNILAGLKGDGKIQLTVNNQSAVNSEFIINNSEFKANATANQLKLNPFIPNLTAPVALKQGQINLSGSLTQLLSGNSLAGLKGDGKIELTANNKPAFNSEFRIQNSGVTIKASSDLNQLPLNSLLAQLPNRQFLPQALDIKGNAQFQGRLSVNREQGTGNREQWKKLGLKGNLQLDNFSLNGRQFEPNLKGTIKANLGKEIALNLRGKEDVIAIALDSCSRPRCSAPYLPVSLEIRQTFGQQQPLIASGKRQGDRLQAQIEKFPLTWLKIDPAGKSDLPAFLGGELSANLDFNLFSGEGSGSLKLKEPSFGVLQGQAINAQFSFQDNIARLAAATLQLGESQYNLAGTLNLKTGEIQGKLDVERGRLQDLVAALKTSDWESLRYWLRLAPPPDGRAAQVQPKDNPVGDSAAPLSAQLRLLAEIDRQIREMAAKLKAGGIPDKLKLAGDFNASATLGGTLQDPKLNFQLDGNRWQWYTRNAFPNIIQPLGLVIEEQGFQPINEVLVRGSFAGGTLRLEPARVKLQSTILSAQGSLSQEQSNLNWRVENLSLDTLRHLAPIPQEVAGNIQAAGKLTGSLKNPQMEGQFAFTNGAVNASLLGLTIRGDLRYRDARLALKVTEPASISLNASIPFPVLPQENDRFDITLKLGTEAIALIGPLAQNQITWQGGEGQLDFQAQGRLNLSGTRLSDFQADGKLILKDAVLASPALPQPLTVSGEIAFTPERLKVEQLEGEVANSKFSAAGILPIQEPLKANEPEAANPLTVLLSDSKVQLEGLYRGEVGGEVTVQGTALSPALSGDIRLANGQVILPEAREQLKERLFNLPQQETPAPVSRWLPQTKEKAAFALRLEDLRVSLAGLAVELAPLYRFEFGGKLTLNGSPSNFESLKASGAIVLERGLVNLFETRFLLDRRHNNQIAFVPNQSILNPNLDIKLRTAVSAVPETRQQRRSEWSNEIPDDSLNKLQRVDVSLAIDGPLSELLPNFGKEAGAACQLRANPYLIPANPSLLPEEWQQFSRCFQNFARRGSPDELLASNPIVSLTSTPPRSEGEIIRLLGEQIFAVAEALQGGNTEQLVRFGIVQLGLAMAFQSALYDVESAIGGTIGAADFRLVPFFEPVYQVSPQSFIRLRYDYSFNEVRIEYERRF
jgi:hypothetical protein